MRVFTPTFIKVSDPQITITFFHCTCYKLLQLAIHKCTQSAADLEARGEVTVLMFSTTLSSFVRGFVMVFMILLRQS